MTELEPGGLPEGDQEQVAASRAAALRRYMQPPLPQGAVFGAQQNGEEEAMRVLARVAPGYAGLVIVLVAFGEGSGGGLMLGFGCIGIALGLGFKKRRYRVQLFERDGVGLGRVLRRPAQCMGIGLAVGGLARLVAGASLPAAWTVAGIAAAVPALALLYRYLRGTRLAGWLGYRRSNRNGR